MLRISFAAALALALASPAMTSAQTKSAPVPHAASHAQSLTPEQVHRAAIIIDTHEDTPQRLVDDHYDLADPLGNGQVNLEAIHKGNLGAAFFSIWVEPKLYQGQYAHRTLELIDATRNQAARHPDQIRLTTTADGILAAHREHKFALLMGIEGGHSI